MTEHRPIRCGVGGFDRLLRCDCWNLNRGQDCGRQQQDGIPTKHARTPLSFFLSVEGSHFSREWRSNASAAGLKNLATRGTRAFSLVPLVPYVAPLILSSDQ